nr:hypothetical protein [uncultured Lachnoclostridium sp.]
MRNQIMLLAYIRLAKQALLNVVKKIQLLHNCILTVCEKEESMNFFM